jgi:hypothetical protein
MRPVLLKPPFVSPQRAQFWYEWRRGGIVLPIIVAACCVAATVPLLFEHQMGDLAAALPVYANVYLYVYLPGLLRALPFIAWILGGAVRISGARTGALSLPAFIAMRPITSVEMAVARITSRVAGAVLAFAILMACAFAWFMLPGLVMDSQSEQVVAKGPLLSLLVHQLSLREFAVAGVYILLILGLTVRNYTVGQFAYTYMLAVYAAPVLAFSLLSTGTFHGFNIADCYVLLGIAVALKALGALLVLIQLHRRKLASAMAICTIVALWCAAVVCVHQAFMFVVAADSPLNRLIGFAEFHNPTLRGPALLMAIFWTPFVRLAAAPLMLDRNRHNAI